MEVLKYMYPLAPIKMEMTLRELINSVEAEQYSDSPLFLQLTQTKPEYGASRHIQVAESDGNIIVTGVHVGSLGDILTYSIDRCRSPKAPYLGSATHRTTERKIISI